MWLWRHNCVYSQLQLFIHLFQKCLLSFNDMADIEWLLGVIVVSKAETLRRPNMFVGKQTAMEEIN